MTRHLIALCSLLLVSGVSAFASQCPPSSPALIQAGHTLFTNNCVICHGANGDGKGVAAAGLNPAPRDFVHGKFVNGNSPDQVFNTITNGISGSAMAGFGSSLSKSDRCKLVYYILSLKK